MSDYRLGNFEFDTEEELAEARKELQLVKAVKDKYDINNTKVAKTIIDKFTPKTIIGHRFCIQLHDICAQEENEAILEAIDKGIVEKRLIANKTDDKLNTISTKDGEKYPLNDESKNHNDEIQVREDSSIHDQEKVSDSTYSSSSELANSLLEFAAQVAVAYMDKQWEEMNAPEIRIYSGTGGKQMYTLKNDKIYEGWDTGKYSGKVAYMIKDNVIYKGTDTGRYSGSIAYKILDGVVYEGTNTSRYSGKVAYTIVDDVIYEGTNTNRWTGKVPFTIKR